MQGNADSAVPVGVFWDIENCHVPKGVAATSIVTRIRERFYHGGFEAEFICVCDIFKENAEIIDELNSVQVDIIHVKAVGKNAADDKLRQCMRRFADTHPSQSKVILISSDVNFITDLSDLRHRKNLYIILIHNRQVNEALLRCAHENYIFDEIFGGLPLRNPPKAPETQELSLIVTGYDQDLPAEKINNRLKQLSANCGGKVIHTECGISILRFSTADDTRRARTRLEGEDVHGSTITASVVQLPPSEKFAKPTVPRKSPIKQHLEKRLGSPSKFDSSDRGKKHCYNKSPQCRKQIFPSVPREVSRSVPPGGSYHQESSGDFGGSSSYPNSFGRNFQAGYHQSFPPGHHQGFPPGPHQGFPPGHHRRNQTLDSVPVREDPRSSEPSHPNPFHHSFSTPDFGAVTQVETDNPVPQYRILPRTSNQRQQPLQTSTFPDATKPKAKPQAGFRGRQLSPQPSPERASRRRKSPKATAAIRLDVEPPNPPDFRKRNHSRSSESPPENLKNEVWQRAVAASAQLSLKISCESSDTQPDSTVDSMMPREAPLGREQLLLQQQRYQEQQQQRLNREGIPSPAILTNVDAPLAPNPQSPSCMPKMRNYRRYSSSPGPGGGSHYPYNSYSNGSLPSDCGDSNFHSNNFRPIHMNGRRTSPVSPHNMYDGQPPADSVELIVSNLDYNISAKEWKKILYSTFQTQVKVLSVFIKLQSDNTSIGIVRVASIDEARYAISLYHRKKIGYKRIQVALRNDDSMTAAANTRREAIALLTEGKDNKLPLFKFIDLFEKRYHKSISVSELYKMKDTIEIREQGGAGRMVHLAPSLAQYYRPRASSYEQPMVSSLSGPLAPTPEVVEQPVCLVHCPEGSTLYTEAMNSSMLPSVQITLKALAAHVHVLLQHHQGSMPLMSFPVCYGAFFPALLPCKDGVPLEHLISCIPGTQILVSKLGIKKVQWLENQPPSADGSTAPCESLANCPSPLLSQQLGQISREITELLKNSPHCRMPVSKFIPTYHHHFGRQCRVADYGYTKLMELFEAIPHVVQVLGSGDRRVLALSHRAQLRRFMADLLRILKTAPGKQVELEEFPEVYEKHFGKPWDVTQYGVCFLEDLLNEMPTTSVMVCTEGAKTYIRIPHREQTSEEAEKTKQFAVEVVDLLQHNHQCRMAFNKFIPSYHHHFGHQCKVSDYGFTKLTDLFEAISHVVEMEEEGEERILKLAQHEMRKVLGKQISDLLRSENRNCLPLMELESAYSRQYGFRICYDDFQAADIRELMDKLKHIVQVEKHEGVEYVMLRPRTELPPLALRVLRLLMDQSQAGLPLVEMCSWYQNNFKEECDVRRIQEELIDFVQVIGEGGSAIIRLTNLQMLARDIRRLLIKHLNSIDLGQFEEAFQQEYSREVKPALYGFPSLPSLLMSFPHVCLLRGKNSRRTVELSPTLGLPKSGEFTTQMLPETGSCSLWPGSLPHNSVPSDTVPDVLDAELAREARGMDLLGDAVPSSVPSPALRPTPGELRRTGQDAGESSLWEMSSGERQAQRTPLCQTPTTQLLQLAAQHLPPGIGGGAQHLPQRGHQQASSLVASSSSSSSRSQPDLPASHYNDSNWLGLASHQQSSPYDDKLGKSVEPPCDLGAGNGVESHPESESAAAAGAAESDSAPNGVDQENEALNNTFDLDSAKNESYEKNFEENQPLETSSVNSISPHRSPARKSRIAAKFPKCS